MNAKVYCFVSPKGGSGKTSLAANIATFVVAIGRKCLLVDCDHATHGMTLLYLNEVGERADSHTKGLFDLEGSEDLGDLLPKSVVELPSGVHLWPALYRSAVAGDPGSYDADALASLVEAARESYDVIILDAQAGTDTYARGAMRRSVSDEVVIVSEFDPLSAAGVEMMKRSIGDDLGYARTWILLNKILPEFIKGYGEFMSVTKYLPPIPWDIDVVRAYAKRELAFDIDGTNDFTLALIQTSRLLLDSVCHDDIETWMEERAYSLKAPILNQLQSARAELEHWLKTRQRSERNRRLRTLFLTSIGTCLLVVAVVVVSNAFGPSSTPADYARIGVAALALVACVTALVARFTRRRTRGGVDPVRSRIRELEDRVGRLNTLMETDDEIVIRRARDNAIE